MGLSIILGVIAFWRYKESEKHLHIAFDEIRAAGAALSTEECVSRVLSWRTECEAMKSLCDQSIPMAMSHCLSAKDRSGYCTALRADASDASADKNRGRWTYQKCKDHGVTKANGYGRDDVKACGHAFTTIQTFCSHDQKGVYL